MENLDKIWEAVVANGSPGVLVTGLMMLLVYLRKQESGVRVELNTTLQRLQREKEALQAIIDKLEAEARAREDEIDKIRSRAREAEDKLDVEKRRADAAELALKKRNEE